MEMIPPNTNGFTSTWMKSFGMYRRGNPPDTSDSHTVRQDYPEGRQLRNMALRLQRTMPTQTGMRVVNGSVGGAAEPRGRTQT